MSERYGVPGCMSNFLQIPSPEQQGERERRSMISYMTWEIFSVIDLQELKKYYEISTVNIWYLCC